MRANFEACLAETLKHEGGWADNPADPGGATMKGITIGTYAQWKGRKVTKAELRAISEDELYAIYRRNYWDKVRGDDLPMGLDLVAFDAAVNSGPVRGATWLQAGLGFEADGRVGPVTIAKAREADLGRAIIAACEARMEFLQGLRTWKTFGKGWTARVNSIERMALAMAKAPATAPSRPQATPIPGKATSPSSPRSVAPVGIGAALVALAGAIAAWGHDIATWIGSFF